MSALLEVRDLSVDYPLPRSMFGRRRTHRAVDGVSFDIAPQETLGLVGESGSGKSTIGRAILGLLRPSGGTITFDGIELTTAAAPVLRRVRPQLQVVFQNPYASLNPALTVGDTIGEPLRVHHGVRGVDLDTAVAGVMRQVGLDPKLAGHYPRAFSGGQRQRIAVARAIALRPRLLIADEPVSALDVSTRGQILNLLDELAEELGLADLFIGHDLAVVRHISDRIAVLYRGQLVEVGPSDEIADHPRHPYTEQLVSAVPVPDPAQQAGRREARRVGAAADVLSTGCRFAPRCEQRMPICAEVEPELRRVDGVDVRCHLYPAVGPGSPARLIEGKPLQIDAAARLSRPAAPITIGATEQTVGELVAARILDRLEATPSDRAFAVACPAGRSPLTTYSALGVLAAERGADLSRLVIAMMDEYVHPRDGSFVLCDATAHYSCRRYVDDRLLPLVNAHLPGERQVAPTRVLCPDPADPAAYERALAAAGGVGVALLASGASDGHVAFNPPGSEPDSVTRVVALAESTRRDNLETFPRFRGLDEVPEWGVTIGLGTILAAEHAVLVLLGTGKSAALGRLMACRDFEPAWPASIVFEHADPWIVVDRAASEGIDGASQ